jgi:hypothetical protein
LEVNFNIMKSDFLIYEKRTPQVAAAKISQLF